MVDTVPSTVNENDLERSTSELTVLSKLEPKI